MHVLCSIMSNCHVNNANPRLTNNLKQRHMHCHHRHIDCLRINLNVTRTTRMFLGFAPPILSTHRFIFYLHTIVCLLASKRVVPSAIWSKQLESTRSLSVCHSQKVMPLLPAVTGVNCQCRIRVCIGIDHPPSFLIFILSPLNIDELEAAMKLQGCTRGGPNK
jgi:hypothetical protein